MKTPRDFIRALMGRLPAPVNVISVCPKCGEKTRAHDPNSDLTYCFTCGAGGRA